MKKILLLLCLITSAFAESLRVGTLNCYLFFDPQIQHVGRVDDEERMDGVAYQQKTENLAQFVRGADFVGLQEIGGAEEVQALASKAGMQWSYVPGRDTATGEQVAAIYNLPGWKITPGQRVPALDRFLSKHLLVRAVSPAGRTVEFLIVHLLRPFNDQAKHANQIAEVRKWAEGETGRSGATVIIIGDMNDATIARGSSLFGIGTEAGELLDYAPTHLTNKPFDRLVLVGPGVWRQASIVKAPYGQRPTAAEKRVWTDHFFLSANVVLPAPAAR